MTETRMKDAEARGIVHSLRIFLDMPRTISDADALAHIRKIAFAEDAGTQAIIAAIETT